MDRESMPMTNNLDIKPTIEAFTLPNRFGGALVDLRTLVGTSAFTGEGDQFWALDITKAVINPVLGNIAIDFESHSINPDQVLERPTDALASSITRIEVEQSSDSLRKFEISLGFDPERFSLVSQILQKRGDNLAAVLKEIQSGEGIIHLETAQQLGHTLRMVNLNEALTRETGKPGLAFIVPNVDNVRLCNKQIQEGKALPWRQLFEPGYCLDPKLIFPMDPEDKDFFKTLALTSVLNRHILALALGAIQSGSKIIWINDARHEGPALFRSVCDWLTKNKERTRGTIHMFQLAYLILDPVDRIPEQIKKDTKDVKEELVRRARERFPGLPIADGVRFMRHKMLAQAFVSQICRDHSLPAEARTLYMTSFNSKDLITSQLDETSQRAIQSQEVLVIPEIAAKTEGESAEVSSIVITLGTSGHSQSKEIIRNAASAVKLNPNLKITLAGKGTDKDSVTNILGAETPSNLQTLGVIPESDHNRLLRNADVIVIKTTRNTRAIIGPAISRGQGLLLLPPDINIPQVTTGLFELSYVCETLDEHLNDTQIALSALKELGISTPEELILNPDRNLLDQALLAKNHSERIELSVRRRMGTPTDLAQIILKIVKK